MYKYFANPLPALVDGLRHGFYERLAPIANTWQTRLKSSRPRFPAKLDAFLRTCHAAGQRRPTPLLLSYQAGGHNCLHQDIYGDVAFRLQVVLGLSRRVGRRGRRAPLRRASVARSRAATGQARAVRSAVFSTRERPVTGSRGDYRVALSSRRQHDHVGITDGARDHRSCCAGIQSLHPDLDSPCASGERSAACSDSSRVLVAATVVVSVQVQRSRKFFISVDMEGIIGVVDPAQLGPGGFE